MHLSVSVVGGASLPVGQGRADAAAVALPVVPASDERGDVGALAATGWVLPDALIAELGQFLSDVSHRGDAATLHSLPRPARDPGHVLLFGVGDAGARAWRDAGAALHRAASERYATLAVALPAGQASAVAAELALGAWLSAYRFTLPSERTGRPARAATGPAAPRLRRLVLVAQPDEVGAATAAVRQSRVLAEAVILARDLTNTPSRQKSPAWFAGRVAEAAAGRPGVSLRVRDERELADEGFGGVLAVGSGSPRPPRLVELSWRPRRSRAHVVLVGKGICFDTGGISMKPLDGMKLMRKDMGAAAAVCATVLAAADLALPVRVTAVVPLAENLVSGSAMRPGDVIRHYGGTTTEVLNTDAEGRLVLADALAYAARRLRPDYLIDLATLTGASHVAVGKQIAVLSSDNSSLVEALRSAGDEAGEAVWPLPLPDDYVGLLRSDVADLANVGQTSEAGALVAALFLREFTGDLRKQWAHIDMSAPSWSDRDAGPLVKGATGWGVRLLVRFLSHL